VALHDTRINGVARRSAFVLYTAVAPYARDVALDEYENGFECRNAAGDNEDEDFGPET